MTQQEKQLLLKDLCGRLPYGVKGFVDGLSTVSLRGFADYVATDVAIEHNGDLIWMEVSNFKPYLRPMSSMTEEEKSEWIDGGLEVLKSVVRKRTTGIDNEPNAESPSFSIDWLNAHHFDYRGLIEKGLALEVPEGMYKTE